MNKNTIMNQGLKTYIHTNTSGIFTDQDLGLLQNQIEEHKYYINQTIPWTITWDDAAFSWMENVFTPILQVIDSWEVQKAFPAQTRNQLYFNISNHWYYLLEKNPLTSAGYAAVSYAAEFGSGLGRWLSKLSLSRSAA